MALLTYSVLTDRQRIASFEKGIIYYTIFTNKYQVKMCCELWVILIGRWFPPRGNSWGEC